MLSSSTVSRISQVSASYSENVDLEIVDHIIDRASDATTFPEVYKAYVEVLEDHGVSPAKDAAYYQFLLKLGIVRAPTWGERWAIWRRTHAPHGLSARVPLSPQVPNTSNLADIKKRVPFLANASSDLDEAFAKSTDDGDGEGDEGSVISYLASLQRPSPRKVMGLVGYTPSASFDESHDGPYRTSTPIFDRARDTLRPPPYTESEVSDVSGSRVSYGEGEYLDEENGKLVDAFSTPRGLAQPLADLTLDTRDEDEEEEICEYDDDSTGSIDTMLAWEMERRADEFYRTGLMGRCWDVWTQSSDWVQKTSAQIDTVRSHILLRQALLQWRRAQERLLDLPNTADAHRRQHLQFLALSKWVEALKNRDLARREDDWLYEQERRDVGTAWVRWREALGTRRTNRFLKDISTRERDWRADKDEELLRGTLQAWHDQTRERVGTRTADERYEVRLLRDVVRRWRDTAAHSRDLQSRLAAWNHAQETRVVGEVFDGWRQTVRLGQIEIGLAHMSERRLQSRVWSVWRKKSRQYQTADRLSTLGTMQRGWKIWRDRLAQRRANETKAIRLSRKQDLKLLSSVLQKWKTAERGELLLRVRTDRLRREVIEKWRSTLCEKAEQLELAEAHCTQRDARIKSRAFAAWRQRLSNIEAAEDAADSLRSTALVASGFKKWHQSSRKISDAEVAADKARAFFLQREVFRAWSISLAQTRRDRWVEERRLEELRDTFHEWQRETVKSIERKRALVAFQKKREKSLLQSTMKSWTHRIIEIKSRELDVKEQRDAGLQSDGFAIWRDRAKRIRDAQDLSRSFIEVSSNQSLKRVFRYWKSEAIKSRDRRIKLEETLHDRDDALVVHCFETWVDKFREGRLAELEQEVQLRQEDALMFKFWDRWVASAKVLPAVQFDNARTKQLAWTRWRKAFELASAAKAMEKARDHELLADILKIWRGATAAKVASKPKRTRGRRAQTPEQEMRSSTSSTAAAGPSKPRRSIGSPILGGRGATASPTNQEPAYTRLRSELVRPRIASRGPPVLQQETGPDQQNQSPLVRALRGALSDK